MFEVGDLDNPESMGRFFQLAKYLIGIICTVTVAVVSIITWSNSNYESKSEAANTRSLYDEKIKQQAAAVQGLQNDLTALKTEVAQIRSGQNQIQSDVSYIKGRLEPALKLVK